MSTEKTENPYVKIKGMAGDDCVCPLNKLRDPNSISDAALENCVGEAVVGRHAGQLEIVDRVI